MESKRILARLMANENIEVIWGKFKTASFDLESRVLKLPILKDASVDVNDMFIAHEVGHALWTPNVPITAYINVVEDIRIERMIQNKYPGLISIWKRAYSELHGKDFFGIVDKDVNEMALPDRINVKAKLRHLVDVHFHEDEMDVVNQCFSANTWEEVVAAAEALKQKHKEELEEPEQPITRDQERNSEDSSPPTDIDETSPSEEEEEEEETPDCDESPTSDEADDTGESVGHGEDEEFDGNDEDFGNGDDDLCETLSNFEKNLEDLFDTDNSTIHVYGPSVRDLSNIIVSYDEVFKSRERSTMYKCHNTCVETDSIFRKELKELNSYADMLAKEFERKKAANQYARSATSRRGVIDVNALHRYKFSDDIFKSVTTLADASSHGMIMFVDYSISMNSVIADVQRQLLSLVLFCRKVNIPFEVYNFTSGSGGAGQTQYPYGHVSYQFTTIAELFNSKMNKHEFNHAVKDIWLQITFGTSVASKYEQLVATPLLEAALLAHPIAERFRDRHPIQKLNVMFLTDGVGHTLSYRGHVENPSQHDPINKKAVIHMKKYDIAYKGGRTRKSQEILTKSLAQHLNCIVTGFFIPTSVDYMKSEINCALDYTGDIDHLVKIVNKEHCIAIDNTKGYHRYFITANAAKLRKEDEELKVEDGMSAAKVASQFKKSRRSKSRNRMFVNKFIELIS